MDRPGVVPTFLGIRRLGIRKASPTPLAGGALFCRPSWMGCRCTRGAVWSLPPLLDTLMSGARSAGPGKPHHGRELLAHCSLMWPRVLARGALPGRPAWLLHRSPVLLPITGSSKVAHLEENVAAAELVLPTDLIDERPRGAPPRPNRSSRHQTSVIIRPTAGSRHLQPWILASLGFVHLDLGSKRPRSRRAAQVSQDG
jgi:hypothetical protein